MSENNIRIDLILASTSPRRAQLLGLLGVNFRVEAVDALETFKHDPKDTVISNAKRKAEKAMAMFPSSLILSADTVIDFEGRIIGKPETTEKAYKILKSFSGKTHRCTTAVCLVKYDFIEVRTEQTLVHFKNLKDSEISSYIEKVNPCDKAGGYGIQDLGWSLVRSIEGSFDNVMGLPLSKVLEMFSLAKVRGIM